MNVLQIVFAPFLSMVQKTRQSAPCMAQTVDVDILYSFLVTIRRFCLFVQLTIEYE